MNTLIYAMNSLPNGISKLEGGGYSIDSILSAIQKFTGWATRVGIVASGAALVIGFIILAVSDVDQKERVKQRIKQTLFGVAGIVLSLSLINLVIELFI